MIEGSSKLNCKLCTEELAKQQDERRKTALDKLTRMSEEFGGYEELLKEDLDENA